MADKKEGGDKPNWREGDWNCPKCDAHNFSRRSSCFKCGENAKASNSKREENDDDNRHPGDWDCPFCYCMNFARRTECFRCSRPRPQRGFEYGMRRQRFTEESPPRHDGWKDGDWECTEPTCGTHNFAKRRECFRCKRPRVYNMPPPHHGPHHGSYGGRERDYGRFYGQHPPVPPPHPHYPYPNPVNPPPSEYITTDRNSWSTFDYQKY